MVSDVASPSFPPPPSDARWRQASMDVLAALRLALRQAIGFSSGTGQKSGDVQKRFGVRFELSWEIYSVVAEGNVVNCAPHVPTPPGMKRLCGAMRKEGVPESDVIAVENAYEAFLSHVNESAGDRTLFDAMMVRIIGGETAAQNELVHREASFEAQRSILGVEQHLQLTSHILHPSATGPDHVDVACLLKRCRIVRLNVGQPFKVYSYIPTDNPNVSLLQPLDVAASEKHGMPLLPAFCSNAELPLRKRAEGNTTIFEWEPEEIGPKGGVDIALGWVDRNIPLKIRSGLFSFVFRTTSRAILRRAVFDFFVHRPTYGTLEQSVSRYGNVFEHPNSSVDIAATDCPQLPMYEQIEFMGGGASAAHLAGVPDYVKMLEYACEQMKWNLQDFDLYRLTVDYPFINTMIVQMFRFPSLPV